jgi:hypothetical protein
MVRRSVATMHVKRGICVWQTDVWTTRVRLPRPYVRTGAALDRSKQQRYVATCYDQYLTISRSWPPAHHPHWGSWHGQSRQSTESWWPIMHCNAKLASSVFTIKQSVVLQRLYVWGACQLPLWSDSFCEVEMLQGRCEFLKGTEGKWLVLP